MQQIIEINCTDINDFRFKLNHDSNFKKKVFRGVSNSSYKLETTYERLFLNTNTKEIDRSKHSEAIEYKLFSEILKHEKIQPTEFQFAPLDKMMEILTKMQHHGAPTRLMDWTHDPNIALYFASKSDNNAPDLAVYCLDIDALRNIESCLNIVEENEDWSGIYEKLTESQRFFTNRELEANYYLLKPGMTERIDKQKGLFIFTGNGYFDFTHNLYNSRFNHIKRNVIKKYIIPKTQEIRQNIRRELSEEFNIDDLSLFPGTNYPTKELELVARQFIKRIFPL